MNLDLIKVLKKYINREVEITVREETKNEEVLNEEPAVARLKTSITFLGIFGIDDRPLFLLGRMSAGKLVIFRRVNWSYSDEDTGIAYHSFSGIIEKFGHIALLDFFRCYRLTDPDDVKRAFGYRKEIVQGQATWLNWSEPVESDDSDYIATVKNLTQIV